MITQLLKALAVMSLLAGSFDHAFSESQLPSVMQKDREAVVTNPLPVPIVALVVARDNGGRIVSNVSMAIAANGSHPLGKMSEKNVAVERIEVINANVPLKHAPQPCGQGKSLDRRPSIAEIKEGLKVFEISETSAAVERVAAVAELAQLELEQKQDEKNTFRNDPLRLELQRQFKERNADLDPMLQADLRRKEGNEAVQNLWSDVSDRALAWAKADWEKLSILKQEKDLLKPIVEQAKLATQIKRTDLESAERQVKAEAQFLAVAHSSLAAIPQNEPQGMFTLTSGPAQLCRQGNGQEGLIRIEGDASNNVSIVLAEATFDKGQAQKTFFRRVGKSTGWIARIYWPVSARRADFRIRILSNQEWRQLSGSVEVARSTPSDDFANARKALKIIEKKFKETNFRAAGADNIKTVPAF